MIALGFDTSNYTTSVAAFDGDHIYNCSKILEVRSGELGLRQSDALFAHLKNLPELSESLISKVNDGEITAVGVSVKPRAVEGSYMPCFMAGITCAKVFGALNRTPIVEVSHQQGHIAAAIWSSGRKDLFCRPFFAWHLSGGTTELLLVNPNNNNFNCEIIGGTSDISAGQIIDRTGKLLSLPFPSGRFLDELARNNENRDCFKVKCVENFFSFSGLENKIRSYHELHADNETARYALLSVVKAVETVTKKVLADHPDYPVLFSGGVSSNSLIREKMSFCDAVFGTPAFSTDNAAGTAILAYMAGVGHGS